MKPPDISKLGKYDITGELGRGAMGVVYKGFDPGIERFVAIKTVRRDLMVEDDSDATTTQIERFKREAKAAGRMTHPNIVSIYEYGEDGATAYIAMEFINGKSLKDYFDRSERFDIPTIVRIMSEMLAALDYSHRSGIVHRDIKPANIMINEAGEVKITDFGIARLESSSLTQAGTVLGTPSYMSPEQFMGQQVDARSDLFSAGAVLYQLLTGEKPFTGALTTIMHKVLNTQPEPPSFLNVQVPRAFDAVVAKAMAKRPADRYNSAADFAAAIREALEAKPVPLPPGGGDMEATVIESAALAGPARPAEEMAGIGTDARRRTQSPPPAAPDQEPRKKGSPIGLIAAGVVGVLAVGGGVGWFLMQPPGVVEPPAVGQGADRQDQDRQAQAAAERERAAREAAERDRLARESAERERLAREQADRDRAAREQAARDQAERERLAQEQADRDRLAREQAERDRQQAAQQAADQAQRQQVSGLQAALPQVRDSLGRYECSVLSADVTSEGILRVAGVSGDATVPAQLKQALASVAPNGRLTLDVATTANLLCPPLKTIKAALARGGAMDIQPVTPDGVFRNGQDLVIQVEGPDFPSYLQVDYYTLEGFVVHLLPNPMETDIRLPAGQRRLLGDRSRGGRFWTIGPPFGRELIVAIASPQPLFTSPRPEAEQATAYLSELERALQAATRGNRAPAATALFIKTGEK